MQTIHICHVVFELYMREKKAEKKNKIEIFTLDFLNSEKD